jgi:hypothetical protein
MEQRTTAHAMFVQEPLAVISLTQATYRILRKLARIGDKAQDNEDAKLSQNLW